MHLAASLAAAAAFPRPEKLSAFTDHLPREWIELALRATGTATIRRRRLPAEQVVWLVLGMALFRDRSVVEIVDKLDLALPGPGEAPVAPSAVPQARARLGNEPWSGGSSPTRPSSGRTRAPAAIDGAASLCTLSMARRCVCPPPPRTALISATRRGGPPAPTRWPVSSRSWPCARIS